MPQIDFYNHNAHIAYPLQEQEVPGFLFGSQRLAVDALIDAGVLLGIDADYDPSYRILLTRITVAGAVVTFHFMDTTNSATFDFVCNTADPFGTIHEIYANEGVTFGEAFLVTGNLNLGFPNGVYGVRRFLS